MPNGRASGRVTAETTAARELPTVDLSRITLGPVDLGTCVVRLRRPQLSDAARWREIRLRDRRWIEPFAITSPLDWERRHLPRRWVRECFVAWADMRAGRGYSGAIEVDGEFAGQVEFWVVDQEARTAEISVWIDSRWAGRSIIAQISAMMVEFLFGPLGITRIIAPIALDNTAAIRCVHSLGFQREAVMGLSFDAGGAPQDHALWALIPTDVPAGGYPDVESGHVRLSATAPTRRAAGGPSPAVVAVAAARLLAWRLWQRLRWRPRLAAVSLLVPHARAVVVHTRTRRGLARRRQTPRSVTDLALTLLVDGRHAGEFRFHESDLPGHSLGLSGWADPELAEVTIRAAALREVVHYGFTALGPRRIAMEIPTGDPTALAVAAAAGFTHEGVLRDHRGPTGLRTDHALWARTAPTIDERDS